MRRFLTFCIALVWIGTIAVLAYNGQLSMLADVFSWSPSGLPLGAILLVSSAIWGTKAAWLWQKGESLDRSEATWATLTMLGVPIIVFVVLFLLLSSVGADPF